jgi:hypothetical protein
MINIDRIYVKETMFTIDGSEHCNEILEYQMTVKENVVDGGCGLKIIFKDKLLYEIYEYYIEKQYIYKKNRLLEPIEIGFKLPAYKPLNYFEGNENIKGLHQIGGSFSEEFQQPEHNCLSQFQYLGYINNEDNNFNWLPFKLHLTCPIYLYFEELFLDYSDPQKPVIINREELERMPSNFDEEINKSSYIEFESKKISFDIKKGYNYISDNDIDMCSGLPNFIQGVFIPECPKTGRKMKYVCQIYKGTKTKISNIVPRNDWYKTYFEKMDFSGSDLYVFFEPTSKVACYFMQGT